MTCSIDGASEETYRRYRVGGSFERVIENIREINRWKAKLGSLHPVLNWQFIIFGHNEHEIGKARRMAGELTMRFSTKQTWDDDFSPVRDRALVRRESGTNAATRAEFEAKAGGRDMMQIICHQLWDSPQINWDGKLLGCCRNFWGDFGGNAFKDGLEACLEGEKISYAREMLLGRQPTRADIPCDTCDIYLKMRASNRWLKRPKPA